MVARKLCWILMVAATAYGADSGAMLYGNGIVVRNGEAIPSSSAVFPGDLLETKANSVANLNSIGSSIVILPGSLVEFQGQNISVEHGIVKVATSHGIGVRVGCYTIVPLSSAWTRFEVNDVNGTIEVAAKQNDIRLERLAHAGSTKEVLTQRSSGILHEGEQATRDESADCSTGSRKNEIGATPAANGGILNSKAAKDLALGGVAGLGLWLALDQDDPPSPWKP